MRKLPPLASDPFAEQRVRRVIYESDDHLWEITVVDAGNLIGAG
jgi:hypothetical protein